MCLGCQTLVTFLGNAQLDTLALGQGNVGLVTLANDEHIGQSGGKDVSLGILDVDNVEGAGMSFAVDNGTDTTQISTSGDHAQIAYKK